MKLNNYFLMICLIASVFTMTSCGDMVKSLATTRITVEKGAIPPGFGKEETVLICIITGKKSYDKYMKKYVSEEYHGKYEFVLEENLDSEKYKDIATYRYVFDRNTIDKTEVWMNSSTGRMEPRTITTSAYFIMDRKEDITYKSPMTSSFFAKLIQAYMINLESERLRNQ